MGAREGGVFVTQTLSGYFRKAVCKLIEFLAAFNLGIRYVD